MENQRQTRRQRTVMGAKIAFHHQGSLIDCWVRDLAEGGARIRLESPVGIPDRFTLIVEKDGRSRECAVRWRRAKEIGVAFV